MRKAAAGMSPAQIAASAERIRAYNAALTHEQRSERAKAHIGALTPEQMAAWRGLLGLPEVDPEVDMGGPVHGRLT